MREKELEAREEIRLLETCAAAAQRHGKLLAVNDRADVARAVRAQLQCGSRGGAIARRAVCIGVTHLGSDERRK